MKNILINKLMKKNFMMIIMALVCSMTVSAQDEVQPYFTGKDMPDMMVFLPGPPDSTSVAFMNDVARYYWGKEMRKDPERAAEATRDAVYGLQTILTEFEEAFGMKVSAEETPEIYKVLLDATATCDSICTIPKATYMRRRPFMVFNEETLYPADEPALRLNGSFPSGHTILGWSAALLMSEINPDRATQLLARGYRYGENRLIVGAHWQSDTDAGRLAASAAYARLHTSERFLQQMAKARAEFQTKKGGTAVSAPAATPAATPAAQGRAYTVSGTPATDATRGLVIANGQKLVRSK